MPSHFWADVHGGVTHFPIGLLIASFIFDFIGYVVRKDPWERDLHAAGFYSIVLGALSSLVAVFSGLIVAQWQIAGHGDLRMHHYFVWPAFSLLIGLAVWRIVVRDKASRVGFGIYLLVATIACIFIAIAGYYGGEMAMTG